MKRALIALLFAGMALAGCAEDASPTEDVVGGDMLPRDLLAMAPDVDAGALLADLALYAENYGERAANKPTHEGSRQWMFEQFESYGLEAYRQDFTNGIDQANIMGIKWGESRNEWVVVGGHYDTITDDCLVSEVPVVGVENPCVLRARSQGAYDDGSGTMMTMHLAKAFANTTTKYSIAFVAYDGEERGTQGAAAFVNAFATGYLEGNFSSQPYGEIKVVGAVDLDMIGLNWPGVGNPVNVLTNSELLWSETSAKMTEIGFPDDQVIRKDGLKLGSSDYARFWEVTQEHGGPIPTIFFIAGFEEVGLPSPVPSSVHTPTSPLPLVPFGIYPFWHLEDTMATMTLMAGGADNLEAGFQSTVDTASHIIYKLAADPEFQPDAVPK